MHTFLFFINCFFRWMYTFIADAATLRGGATLTEEKFKCHISSNQRINWSEWQQHCGWDKSVFLSGERKNLEKSEKICWIHQISLNESTESLQTPASSLTHWHKIHQLNIWVNKMWIPEDYFNHLRILSHKIVSLSLKNNTFKQNHSDWTPAKEETASFTLSYFIDLFPVKLKKKDILLRIFYCNSRSYWILLLLRE